MKILRFALALFLATPAFAQDIAKPYTLSGRFTQVKKGTLYLSVYEGNKPKKDSAIISNGQFSFKGKLSDPAMAVLYMDTEKNDWLRFYIQPGHIKVSGTGDTMRLLRVTGSPINDDDQQLKLMLKPINEREESNYALYQTADKQKNQKVIDSLDNLDESTLLDKRKVVSDFVLRYPKSVRSAMAIEEHFSYYAEASDLEPLYNALSNEVKASGSGIKVKQMLDVYKTVAVGMPAPEITQPGTDGKSISLSSLKGQYVLVDFWASWCGPCRKENPNLVKAYNEYHPKGLAILGVSYDTKKDRWENAIQKDGLTWLHVSELKGWQNNSADNYYIKAIPSNVLVDREGKIIAKNLMGKKLYAKLEELFK